MGVRYDRTIWVRTMVAVFACAAIAPATAAAGPGGDASIVATSFQLHDLSAGAQLVTCPAGSRPTMGGITGAAGPLQVNAPLGPSGSTATTTSGDLPTYWYTGMRNGTGTGGAPTVTINAFGICSQTTDAVIYTSSIQSPGPDAEASISMSCPPGQRAIGGGANTTDQNVNSVMEVSGPLDASGTFAGTTDGSVPTRWEVYLRNGPTFSRDYKFFIVCSPGSDAIVATQNMLFSGSDGFGVAGCPPGRRAVGGGFNRLNDSDDELRGNSPTATGAQLNPNFAGAQNGDVPRGWRSEVVAADAGTNTYRAYAICVTDSPPPAAPSGGPTGQRAAALKKCKRKKSKKKRRKCKKRALTLPV